LTFVPRMWALQASISMATALNFNAYLISCLFYSVES
jgi:hypothetical protein